MIVVKKNNKNVEKKCCCEIPCKPLSLSILIQRQLGPFSLGVPPVFGSLALAKQVCQFPIHKLYSKLLAQRTIDVEQKTLLTVCDWNIFIIPDPAHESLKIKKHDIFIIRFLQKRYVINNFEI